MIGIFGGTFDPIHDGHLSMAKALYQQLGLQTVRFMPCKQPLLGKKVIASTAQRLAMLTKALAPFPCFSLDLREIKRATPSYTLNSLRSLHAECPTTPLALIIGSDQLINLNQWYQWTSLLHYAHLVVVPRPCYPSIYPPILQHFIKKNQTTEPAALKQHIAGFLLLTQVKTLTISATCIRAKIHQGLSPAGLLPNSVLDYILEQKLYL